MDDAAGFRSEYWRDDHAHPTLDEHWDPMRYSHRMGELDVPVLHVTGWYDDGAGTYRNFERMSRGAKDERARNAQAIVIGPWIHEANKDRRIGEIDFGPDALVDLDAIEDVWLARWLRGDESADPGPRARIFVMGPNEWRAEQEWPLARAVETPLYLSSDGGANSRFGDGTLSFDPPAAEGSDTYLSDPRRPVPYLYDPVWFQLGGTDDYAAIEQRPDVLVYTSEALAEPLEVVGNVRAVLRVESSARDTDFCAKLVDVHPNGFAQRICDGVVRGRFRNGLEREELLEPGRPYELDVDLWYTGHVFPANHRVRLEVASSAFPKYMRNLQTGGPLATDAEAIVAENTVRHGGDRPSRLLLPVVPPAAQ
jgi:putative CocE/NonD family hydrolase